MTSADATADRWTRLERLVAPYPPALFDLLQQTVALPKSPAVVDVGAGTGRATLPMAARGWRLTAVDTDPEALAGLTRRAAAAGVEIATIQASVEATTVPARSVDLVTAAQSFHWFEPAPALAEMARILRPGGSAALFWNWRDADRSELVRQHQALLREHGADPSQFLEAPLAADEAGRVLRSAPGFETAQRHELEHDWSLTAAEYLELALMPAFVRSMEPRTRGTFERSLTTLVEDAADSASATITIPHRTGVWTARRNAE